MPRQRRGRYPQVARWVRRVACKSCTEFGAVPRLRSGLVPSECPLARTLLADVYVKCLGGRKTRIPASEDANLDGVLSPYVHVMTSCRRMRLDMSVRCMPTSCSGSQFDKVPRTSRGSVFALARVCTAPMQPHYFTHYYSRMFVRTSSLTLDAMCVCVRARVCQGSTRSRRPLGGRFSPLHASPARRCTRVRSPTDYYACPCAHVQRHSMQYVCACVQMAYMVLCAHGNIMQVLYNVYNGGRFSPFRASPARQCSRAPSPTYHCEFSCA